MARPLPIKAGGTDRSLSENVARTEALFASIGEGVITTNDQGIITRINQAALNMLGCKRKDLQGKRFLDVIISVHENGKLVDNYDRAIVKAYQTGKTVHARTLYRRHDASLLPAQVTVAPIILDGHPIGAVEVFRDLTEEIENDKLKSDFISIASHQLRTPLSAINMYTRMLRDGLAGELAPEQQPYIQTILSSVERMNTLIDTLLNITRIEAGGIVIKLRDVQVDDMAREIVTEFLPAARAKNITLTTNIPAVMPTVQTDNLLVKEVCANLLSNAIKYTPEGGKVEFSLTEGSNDIRWQVTDTGYGIPKSAQKSIFLKFFRAENIVGRDVSGTGLGLYLIKNIAESLGGDLWFDSAENKGSTFYFRLPKMRAEG